MHNSLHVDYCVFFQSRMSPSQDSLTLEPGVNPYTSAKHVAARR